ncbi:3'-5' DNA helicase [Polyrhizophydium stewartii]|uniref:DNA helicase n=1 Tax=Polyrhizophydium stewartii TaxID=2732419 RepID=A0ABR4N1V7_9FUNG
MSDGEWDDFDVDEALAAVAAAERSMNLGVHAPAPGVQRTLQAGQRPPQHRPQHVPSLAQVPAPAMPPTTTGFFRQHPQQPPTPAQAPGHLAAGPNAGAGGGVWHQQQVAAPFKLRPLGAPAPSPVCADPFADSLSRSNGLGGGSFWSGHGGPAGTGEPAVHGGWSAHTYPGVPLPAPTPHKTNLAELATWIYPTNYPVRDYQFNIVSRALFANTMVALPTGLGKTFLAAVVMFNFYRWFPEGKIIFMAPTRPLVAQQIEACYNITGIPQEATQELTGSVRADARVAIWAEKRVFFLTPQVLQNDLRAQTCPADKVVLLVVDEAHRAVGAHAYCNVVQELVKARTPFRVLALTATPGSEMQGVQNVVRGLLIQHIEIRTEESLDIRPYIFNRKIEELLVNPTPQMTQILDAFCKIAGVFLTRLNNAGAISERDPRNLSRFKLMVARDSWRQNAQRAGDESTHAVEGDFGIMMSLCSAIELQQKHGIRSFYSSVSSFLAEINALGNKASRARREFATSPELAKLMQYIRGIMARPDFCSHPKLDKLTGVLLEHFSRAQADADADADAQGGAGPSGGNGVPAQQPQTRVMVFSQFRESVDEIVETLNVHQPLLRVMSFVGQSAGKRGSSSKGYTQKEQLEVISKFQSGNYNVLVATSIGEEGLDIGEVDLIVCYDAQTSPIRMLQRMGRTGRKRQGRIVVLLSKGREEDAHRRAQSQYRSVQKAITEGQGSRIQMYSGELANVLPTGARPVCERKVLEISAYQRAGPKRRGKAKAAPPSPTASPSHENADQEQPRPKKRKHAAPKEPKEPKPPKPPKPPKLPKLPKPPKEPKEPKEPKKPRTTKASKAEQPAKPMKRQHVVATLLSESEDDDDALAAIRGVDKTDLRLMADARSVIKSATRKSRAKPRDADAGDTANPAEPRVTPPELPDADRSLAEKPERPLAALQDPEPERKPKPRVVTELSDEPRGDKPAVCRDGDRQSAVADAAASAKPPLLAKKASAMDKLAEFKFNRKQVASAPALQPTVRAASVLPKTEVEADPVALPAQDTPKVAPVELDTQRTDRSPVTVRPAALEDTREQTDTKILPVPTLAAPVLAPERHGPRGTSAPIELSDGEDAAAVFAVDPLYPDRKLVLPKPIRMAAFGSVPVLRPLAFPDFDSIISGKPARADTEQPPAECLRTKSVADSNAARIGDEPASPQVAAATPHPADAVAGGSDALDELADLADLVDFDDISDSEFAALELPSFGSQAKLSPGTTKQRATSFTGFAAHARPPTDTNLSHDQTVQTLETGFHTHDLPAALPRAASLIGSIAQISSIKAVNRQRIQDSSSSPTAPGPVDGGPSFLLHGRTPMTPVPAQTDRARPFVFKTPRPLSRDAPRSTATSPACLNSRPSSGPAADSSTPDSAPRQFLRRRPRAAITSDDENGDDDHIQAVLAKAAAAPSPSDDSNHDDGDSDVGRGAGGVGQGIGRKLVRMTPLLERRAMRNKSRKPPKERAAPVLPATRESTDQSTHPRRKKKRKPKLVGSNPFLDVEAELSSDSAADMVSSDEASSADSQDEADRRFVVSDHDPLSQTDGGHTTGSARSRNVSSEIDIQAFYRKSLLSPELGGLGRKQADARFRFAERYGASIADEYDDDQGMDDDDVEDDEVDALGDEDEFADDDDFEEAPRPPAVRLQRQPLPLKPEASRQIPNPQPVMQPAHLVVANSRLPFDQKLLTGIDVAEIEDLMNMDWDD